MRIEQSTQCYVPLLEIEGEVGPVKIVKDPQ